MQGSLPSSAHRFTLDALTLSILATAAELSTAPTLGSLMDIFTLHLIIIIVLNVKSTC
jgi:hypothetical protein